MESIKMTKSCLLYGDLYNDNIGSDYSVRYFYYEKIFYSEKSLKIIVYHNVKFSMDDLVLITSSRQSIVMCGTFSCIARKWVN